MSALIDTSVFCGGWPFRRLHDATPGELKPRLQALGVTEAWIAPFEGMLYQDPMQANEVLAKTLNRDPFFVQAGVVDVSQATWRQDARACIKDLSCGILKLFPQYHRYALNDPRVDQLCGWAADEGIAVCMQLRMQDERGQHPLVKVPGVPSEELAALALRCPRTKFLACAGYLRDLKILREHNNVWAETSYVETGNALKDAVDAMGGERLVFGSHSPLFYAGASAAKLNVDAKDVSGAVLQAVSSGNAAALRKN